MRYFVVLLTLLAWFNSANADDYKKSIEGGLKIATGNSEEESIYLNAELEDSFREDLTNILKVRADNQKENDVRSKERYFANNQTRLKISDTRYRFVELEYVNDRYSGYNYRISETFGYGRNLLAKPGLKATAQLSAGMRQEKLTDTGQENSWLVRIGSKLKYQFNENTSFSENFDISFDDDTVITAFNSNVKVKVSQKLYFKFNFLLEHIDNVPDGVEKLDTSTIVTIGYDF